MLALANSVVVVCVVVLSLIGTYFRLVLCAGRLRCAVLY